MYTFHSEFKYISCYYLSFIPPKVAMLSLYSNTSHVIIYLNNISRRVLDRVHSNTSHVIIYRISIRHYIYVGTYSNTSHVIIYPTYFCTLSHLKHIIILYFQAFSRFLPSSPMLSILIFLSLLHPPF